MRKRKVNYPPPKTASRGASQAAADAATRRQNDGTIAIDLTARTGRAGIKTGDRVRIMSGLYLGEIAVVESVSSGVIPAAMVRTEAGRARRARTIDLVPEAAEQAVHAADAPVNTEEDATAS